MSEPRVAFLEHLENGVLTDAQSVTLQDPSGTFGIRESVSEAIVVSPGAPTVRVDVGMYEYNIDSLNTQIEYEIFWRVVDSNGNIEFVLGVIPILEVKAGGSGGPVVPPDIVDDPSRSEPIDCDGDGYTDGYKYDLDGDGYFESFDFDNDLAIDQVDVGTVQGHPHGGFGHHTGHSAFGGHGDVFDSRGQRVTGHPHGVSPELDGIPDVPSPRGTPAGDGIWGSTMGYDGTSGYIPATGGQRTNRADCEDIKETDGFWDGISFEKLCTIPIGARGQCVIGETLVDGEFGALTIKDVKIGDHLKVYNRKKKTFEYQQVTKIHVNNTKTGELYKVRTKNGRELVCTSKHPFVVKGQDKHIHAQDLRVGDPLVVEPLDSAHRCYAIPEFEILNEGIIREKLSAIYNKEQIDASIEDLRSRGFCNLMSTDRDSAILARLIGHMFGDGSLPRYFNTNGLGRLGMASFTGFEEEICLVGKDVEGLGFRVGDIQTKQANSSYAQGISKKADCRQAGLAELLYILGTPLGDKVTQEFRIPDWIINHQRFLAQFLSALYGSKGFNPITSKQTLNYLGLAFNKLESLDGQSYADQLVDAFAQFDIPMRVLQQSGTTRETGEKTEKFVILRDGDKELRSLSSTAIQLFSQRIGVSYSPRKEHDFRVMYEYQSYVEKICSAKQALFDEAKSLQKLGLTIAEIQEAVEIERNTLSVWLYRREAGMEVRQPKSILTFSQWYEIYASNGEICDFVSDIEVSDSNEDVYDVTMETIFDFVTNGIVTLDCLKDKAHAMTRAFLKDTDPTCAAFSDDEIDIYLEGSLWAFNAKPTFTAFLWDNLQERWLDIIVKGATVWALYAQGLIEAGREFTITDNGISFTPPPVSDKLHAYAAALLAHYEKELMDIKQNFRPIPAAVGVFSVLDISPSLRRLRHLREKRIF